MVDVRAFQTDMETVIKKVDKELEGAIKEGLTAALLEIFEKWPAHTYYSMANNRVSIIAPIANPRPAERPNEVGAMAGDAAIQLELNLQSVENLNVKNIDRTPFHISNPVEYASDVGFTPGRGDEIYEMAAKTAEELIRRKIFNRITFGIGSL